MTRSWSLRFTLVYVRNWLYSILSLCYAKMRFALTLETVFCHVSSLCSQKMCFALNPRKNTTRPCKLPLTPVSVGNCPFINFNALLQKYAFCPKISRKIHLAHKNYVSRQFMMETDLCQILRLLPKTKFCVKSSERIKFAMKNYFLPEFVLKTGFC